MQQVDVFLDELPASPQQEGDLSGLHVTSRQLNASCKSRDVVGDRRYRVARSPLNLGCGEPLQSQTHDPHAIAVDEAANVFVAAHFWGDNSNDFTTIRYRQARVGDIDDDGDVDADDWARFAGCMAGPDAPPSCDPPDSTRSDLDFDTDVDIRDFANFQRGFGS
jgi:hypothetical protein